MRAKKLARRTAALTDRDQLASGTRRHERLPILCAGMDLELAGKRAIVTGGSRGIGKAVVRQLALEGADVGIAARDEQRIADAATELSALTGRRVVGHRVTPTTTNPCGRWSPRCRTRSAASTSW